MNKIIYSLKVMLKLVEKGHMPISTMMNPNYPRYDCWVFAVTDEFQKDLDEILGGRGNGK